MWSERVMGDSYCGLQTAKHGKADASRRRALANA